MTEEELKATAEKCLVYGEDYYNTLDHEKSVELIAHALVNAHDTGYAAAKAEMRFKLETFNPTYVEGGRVPEDAIEHRNQPRDTNA